MEGAKPQKTMAATKGMDRREFIVTTLTIGGGFALALAFP